MISRALVCFVLLSGCHESHAVGEGDGGTRRDGATRDASAFDATRFDATRFDASVRFDAGGSRDSGPPEPDGGFFEGLLDSCERLCEQALECGLSPSRAECIGGCLEIEIYAVSPECEALTREVFFCAEGLPCEELERAFEGGPCSEVVQSLEARCGPDG